MKVSTSLKKQISDALLKEITQKKAMNSTNIHLYTEILEKGKKLHVGIYSKNLKKSSILAFSDLAPELNWAHPCNYYLFDSEKGKLLEKIDSSLPPPIMICNPDNVDLLHGPVKMKDRIKPSKAGAKRISPKISKALSLAPGNRYAILFSGHSNNRHVNDLEFLYRTLIDVYGFQTGNIYVANHDGTVNYFDDPHPVNKWPGNTTNYRMVVNQHGTRAGMQNIFNTLATRIKPGDFLLIHTNNHGGGKGDGVTDYCMFEYEVNANWIPYYVNDFITDMSVLPAFDVLMVMLEQCRAGGFIDPIINHSMAKWTHVSSAVEANYYSKGGDNWDPFAYDWIAAINGSYADGGALKQVADTNGDGRISAAEAHHYADAVHTYSGYIRRYDGTTPLRDGDKPIAIDKPSGYGSYIFLNRPAHDLYLRDNLDDHGIEPLIDGGISCSPDIIVYNQELLDPNAVLASNTAQNNDTLGDSVEYGQDNFIYLRVQNRGTQATSGTAKVYWAYPSTFPTPGSWNLIGSLTIPSVPAGNFKVVGPLKWAKNNIPAVGHYCFIGLIDGTGDPAPNPATIHTYDDFYNFIRTSNNATWKNFDVVNLFKDSTTNMKFHIQGWPGLHLSSNLVIDLSNVPSDYTIQLKILKRLTAGTSQSNATLIETSDLYQRFNLKAGKVCRINGIHLNPSEDVLAWIDSIVPANAGDGFYRFWLSQIVDGKEMGRVTLMLAVGKYPFTGNCNTGEVHLSTCDWVGKMSRNHKIAYDSLEKAIDHGYNGCRFCLPEYSTD